MADTKNTTAMDSSAARNNIMARLEIHGGITDYSSSEKSVSGYRPWGVAEEPDLSERKERFIRCMEANHTEVILAGKVDIAATISEIVKSKELKTAAIGTGGKYLDQFESGLSGTDLTHYEENIEEWKTRLFDKTDVGVTHVVAGIADTGALVLWPSVEEPRTLSLVPPVHIAVIDESSIESNFPAVMSKYDWSAGMPTNAVLISGPSKTADIQQTLAYGAHGPSELVVIVVSGE